MQLESNLVVNHRRKQEKYLSTYRMYHTLGVNHHRLEVEISLVVAVVAGLSTVIPLTMEERWGSEDVHSSATWPKDEVGQTLRPISSAPALPMQLVVGDAKNRCCRYCWL